MAVSYVYSHTLHICIVRIFLHPTQLLPLQPPSLKSSRCEYAGNVAFSRGDVPWLRTLRQRAISEQRCRLLWYDIQPSACGVSFDTLQHTATHCNTLQHTATQCNTLQPTATHCNPLQHTATHCNTLQHTALHVECRSIKSSHLNLICLFSTERGKRDVEN